MTSRSTRVGSSSLPTQRRSSYPLGCPHRYLVPSEMPTIAADMDTRAASVLLLCSLTKYIALTQTHLQFASSRLILSSATASRLLAMVERLMCTQFLAGLVQPVPYDSALPQHGHWVARWVPGKRPNTTRNNVRFPFFSRVRDPS